MYNKKDNMSSEEILQIIGDEFLCVRRLPHEVISVWSYREGDEERINKPIYLEDGSILNAKREIITGYGTWPADKKFVKETRFISKGGWYYVKRVANTWSTVRFDRKYDTFFAPTLEEAIQLYLNSK